MRWTLFALFAILLAVEATTGYGNYYNNAPAGQYNTPSEWSPFDESHANEPRGDRSGHDNKGKIVVNGECENCVTNRPIIGPTQQYKKPSKWSPFDDSHDNVGSGVTHTNNPPSSNPFDDSHDNAPSGDHSKYGNNHYNLPRTTPSRFRNLPRIFSFTKERVKRANGNTTPNPVKEAPDNSKAAPTTNKVFSGRLPDGTYVHNGPCTNCQLEN